MTGDIAPTRPRVAAWLIGLALLLPFAGAMRIASELEGRLHVHAHAAHEGGHAHDDARHHVHAADDAEDVVYLEDEPDHDHRAPAARRVAQGDGEAPPSASTPTSGMRKVDRVNLGNDAKPLRRAADRIERPPRGPMTA